MGQNDAPFLREMVMKDFKVVEAMYARSAVMNADIKHGLETGRYLLAVKPRKPSRHLIAQREYLQRKRDDGFKKLEVLLPADVYALLQSGLREGESTASLLERLLSKDDNYHISIGEPDE